MSMFLSAGVYSKEKDISDIVATVATSSAALVGYSAKGPTDAITLITSDQQFINMYGIPDPSSGHYMHYAALAYLEKGNVLYCLRVVNGAKYGGVDIMHSTSLEVNAALLAGKLTDTFSAESGLLADTVFQIIGKDQGLWNNRIGITITNVKGGSDLVPTDQYTFVINVFWQDDDGNWAQVESWKVSRKNKIDGFGKQLYLEEKINGMSNYIRVADSALADTYLPRVQVDMLVFAQGDDGSDISSSDLINGWDEFINPDVVDIRLLINGGETVKAVQQEMLTVAETRADCVAIFDMPWDSLSSVTAMTTFRDSTQNFDSSYGTMPGGWVQIYDKYNDMLVGVPPSGYIAAQCAYNDFAGKVWTAPAGSNRGQLNVLGIVGPNGNLVFSEGDRDVLYVDGINPLQTFRGGGQVIWGQKTLQRKASASDRLNVRRLLIVIEKAMAISLRPFVFEINDEVTRFRTEAMLNSYLEDLSAQGAFQTEGGDQGFHVVCDETNNTSAVIARNELAVDVFVKPSRAAEFIQLQTINSPLGTTFNELIARGVAQ